MSSFKKNNLNSTGLYFFLVGGVFPQCTIQNEGWALQNQKSPCCPCWIWCGGYGLSCLGVSVCTFIWYKIYWNYFISGYPLMSFTHLFCIKVYILGGLSLIWASKQHWTTSHPIHFLFVLVKSTKWGGSFYKMSGRKKLRKKKSYFSRYTPGIWFGTMKKLKK